MLNFINIQQVEISPKPMRIQNQTLNSTFQKREEIPELSVTKVLKKHMVQKYL